LWLPLRLPDVPHYPLLRPQVHLPLEKHQIFFGLDRLEDQANLVRCDLGRSMIVVAAGELQEKFGDGIGHLAVLGTSVFAAHSLFGIGQSFAYSTLDDLQ